jgi:hypothetical protein
MLVQKNVRQTAIHNGFIYATNNGVRSASIINKNLNDYKQWGRIASGIWSGIEAFGAELIAVSDSGI